MGEISFVFLTAIDGMFRDRGSGALDGRWKIPFPCFVNFLVYCIIRRLDRKVHFGMVVYSLELHCSSLHAVIPLLFFNLVIVFVGLLFE
jgi:hypothetical protein